VAFEIDGTGEVSCKAVLPIETFDREDFQVPGPVDGLGFSPERPLRIR
jgi:hypothetical protein